MEVRIATPEEIAKISAYSASKGNSPFYPTESIVAFLEHEKEILGFAGVQKALHAAGSFVDEKHRKQGHSYELRRALDNELRRRGFQVYFAFPNTDFEKHLFAKYGIVTEHLAQIRHL